MSEQAVLERNPAPQTEQESPTSASPISPPRNRLEPDQKACVVCILGILGCFFAPWVPLPESNSAALLFMVAQHHAVAYLWAIPVLSVSSLAVIRQKKAVRRFMCTLTAIAVFVGVGYLALLSGPQVLSTMRWGASLSLLFAIMLFAAAEEPMIGLSIDLVAKKIGSRRGSVYSHSFSVPADVHFSAKEFYAKIESAMKAKQWPGVHVFRIGYSEAGMLSHQREYLRIIRHRQFFDLCASTFGRDYFFSIREAEFPAVVSARALFGLLFLLCLGFAVAFQTLGLFFGSFAFAFLVVFASIALRNVLKTGLSRLDGILLQTPIIGPAYEAWFRPDTYFQQDGRMVFLQAVNELTRKAVEEAVSAKGFKHLDFFERHPILGELYKRSRNPIEAVKQPEK